ncbi:MAG: hypothetical protein MJ237_02370 [bacterium]|nr:hypothetical protein [bacterium]
MKKIIISFFLILLLYISIPCISDASGQIQNAEISKIENNLYGFDYANEELAKRVERLEKSVYGKTMQGDLAGRLTKLSKDIIAEQIGSEITPSEDTYREAEEIADNTVDYPIVNEIETKLFNQTYKNRDFHTRIVTIERKLFGKIYDVEDYSTRMERIKKAVMPETIASEPSYNEFNNNSLSSSSLSGLNANRFGNLNTYGQKNYTRPYANYGDYDSSPIQHNPDLNNELADLEYQTFGTEFSGDDTTTRIKRLNSVSNAKKTSGKYDSQKFQQRMSMAMEIGAMLLMILAMVL